MTGKLCCPECGRESTFRESVGGRGGKSWQAFCEWSAAGCRAAIHDTYAKGRTVPAAHDAFVANCELAGFTTALTAKMRDALHRGSPA